MKRINLLRSSFLFLLFPFFLTSCGGNTTETPKEYSATNPRTIKEVNLDSEPVELVAPFTVLTETGETPEELEYKYQNLDENVFDNMYLAIRIAAENSTTKINYKFKTLILHKFLFVKKLVNIIFLMVINM